MVTCGLLTNHRHGNHVLMYEQKNHNYDIFILFLFWKNLFLITAPQTCSPRAKNNKTKRSIDAKI